MLCRFFILFVSASLAWQTAFCQVATEPSETDATLADEAQARQVRIYREALQQGSTEDIRVDAAVGLLLLNSPESRNVLLSALKPNENGATATGSAVCKALIRSRGLSQKINEIAAFREPLLGWLQMQVGEPAQLAAEALLLYDFDEILPFLQNIFNDQELPAKQRVNAVYALQLRPEPSALRVLIGLLDSPELEVSKAAETALQEAFGIPVGTGRKVWSDILTELQLKSPEDIRKERLLRQEMKLREVQTERDRWQKLYLASLDKQYDPLDETGRTTMILEKLDSDLYPVRLWALDKAAKYPVIGERLRESILLLLSDVSRVVRLQTARTLMNMSILNPAQALLNQFKQEKDPEVRLAMFEALGEAVFFAFLPDSTIELPPAIKAQTLSVGADYLQSESPEEAIKGAEVVGKIIELNKLDKELMKDYLQRLYDRYQQSRGQGGTLGAELLGILAKLCGQGGAKAVACSLYEPLFMEVLTERKEPGLRLAAVQGLSYVDKVKALELFKEYGLTKDEDLAVRHVVIDVAGQTGGMSDLVWLLDALSTNGYSDHAWDAIIKICQRQDPAFLLDWLSELEAAVGTKEEYVREILRIAEQKAVGAKKEDLLKRVQIRTIRWFGGRKDWENAVVYLESIDYIQNQMDFGDNLQQEVFEIFLNARALDKVSQLIKSKLASTDFTQESPFLVLLDAFFQDPDILLETKQGLLKLLVEINAENRPIWKKFTNKQDLDLIKISPSPISPETSDDDAVPVSPSVGL